MTLAYDYPLLGLFLTALWIYFIVIWLVIMYHVIVDIFRREDKGLVKASWLFIIFILPLLGVLAYVVVRGQTPIGLNVTSATSDNVPRPSRF
jgi:hypothetical protein